MFYIKIAKRPQKVNKENLFLLMKEYSDIIIGIYDYPVEFNWDGSFLYPFDKNDENDETFSSVKTAEEMAAKLLSYGPQITEAIAALDKSSFSIFIADSHLDNDYHTREIYSNLTRIICDKAFPEK